MNEIDFVLALIDASGGTIHGRTLLQKRAFFTAVLSGIDPGLGFDAHYYGPYSSTVDNVISQLKNLNFVEERNTAFGVISGGFEMKRYDYSLTADGKKVLERLRSSAEYRTISESVQKIKEAGDPDYVTLSIAAKIFFILNRRNKAMSTAEIQKEGAKLNWDIQPPVLTHAVTFLQKLELAKDA
jgi:uncharacterized protein YwgA